MFKCFLFRVIDIQQTQTRQKKFSYAVMRDCWLAEPGMRPSFAELAQKIASVLTEGSKGVSQAILIMLFCCCYFDDVILIMLF